MIGSFGFPGEFSIENSVGFDVLVSQAVVELVNGNLVDPVVVENVGKVLVSEKGFVSMPGWVHASVKWSEAAFVREQFLVAMLSEAQPLIERNEELHEAIHFGLSDCQKGKEKHQRDPHCLEIEKVEFKMKNCKGFVKSHHCQKIKEKGEAKGE